MKKKSFREKMMASGIWILPFTMMLSYKVFKMLDPNFMGNRLNVFACMGLAIIPIFHLVKLFVWLPYNIYLLIIH